MNLADLVAHHARYHGSKLAVDARDSSATYAEFYGLARRISARLRAGGVGIGDLVGVSMRDTPTHLAALIGVAHLGGTILPLDWRATNADVGRTLTRFTPKTVLTDGMSPLPDGVAVVQLDAIEAIEPDSQPPAPLTNSPLVYSLTSGTTGEPKAIVLTHEQLFGRAMALLLERVIQPDDRFLAILPLAYSNGRVILLSLLAIGATVVMFPTLFAAGELIEFVNRRRVDAMMVSPNIVRNLLAVDSPFGLLMPRLRALVSGGSKLQPEERTAVSARVAPNVIDYYGSTGGGPTAIIARGEDGTAPTSMGRPMLSLTVEVADDDGRVLPTGEIGRLRVRGPGVAQAFAGAVEAGDEAFRDGWYYPGDLGSFDERGLLHLHGRASELIKRGGLMVYAQEVEQALRRHAGVTDAAVIGAPSPELGQEVVAFVTTRSPITERDLIRHCRRELAPFKVPARIEILRELPRNSGGKVIKSELLSRASSRAGLV